MRYYKQVSDGYILAIGTGPGGMEIEKAEYDGINSVMENAPVPEDGYGYMLKTDLTWERVEVADVEIEPEETPQSMWDELAKAITEGVNSL